ncbi:MAG: ORF6N domain-containing protein [Spirochaetes bacterium]|nr:MAG: ORF6N domain-containing protein [Spirochaetota bacterium]
MSKSKELSINDNVKDRIFTIRGMQVMIDRDLADFYEIPTKRLNEQVKRNIDRFPEVFRFQLIDSEKNELVANCDRFEKLKYSSVNPYVFTEQGVAMLSAVLRSKTAISISIQIMQAFVEMKNFMSTNAGIFQRLDKVEQKQIESDKNFERIFDALKDKSIKPRQGIFYNGQIFDAYVFVADLIKSATKSILLIDNYIDESVLKLFVKRNKNVTASIYTRNFTKILKQDLKKYNSQYPAIIIKEFSEAHDRFLIIDETIIYHFGASLKDLGKKWFAFSKMDIGALEILNRIKGSAS